MECHATIKEPEDGENYWTITIPEINHVCMADDMDELLSKMHHAKEAYEREQNIKASTAGREQDAQECTEQIS
jgi:hypothetical protein